MVCSVQDFFYTGNLIPNSNSNIIVLIPKVHGATSMGDFRPIALANFEFKIITKILADRLVVIAMRIIFVHHIEGVSMTVIFQIV